MAKVPWTVGLATLVLGAAASGQSLLYDIEGSRAGSGLAWAVRSVGDVDVDGVPDIAASESGLWTVFSGATGRELFRLAGPRHLSSLGGDADGDGHGDVVVSYQHRVCIVSGDGGRLITTVDVPPRGPTSYLRAEGGRDVDGDAVPDILVTDTRNPSGPDRVTVCSGLTGEKLHVLNGGPGFGGRGVFLDDVDGDGLADFALSDAHRLPRGAIHVYSGFGGTLIRTITNNLPGAPFGATVQRAGDHDGDGISDLLTTGGAGGLCVVSTASGAILLQPPPLSLSVPPLFVYPAAFDTVGDWNGDGVAEIIASGFDGSSFMFTPAAAPGFVQILSGATGAVISRIFTDDPSETFGLACAAAGDVSGDGLIDILVVAPSYRGTRGRLAVIHGGRRPGTREDLLLETGVGGTIGLGPDVSTVQTPDVVTVRLTTQQAPVLDPGGYTMSFSIPPAAAGLSAVVQGFALSAGARNGFFAATDGHELELR